MSTLYLYYIRTIYVYVIFTVFTFRQKNFHIYPENTSLVGNGHNKQNVYGMNDNIALKYQIMTI